MACEWLQGMAEHAAPCVLLRVSTQGEDQKKLDVVSNEVFKNCLASSGRTVRRVVAAQGPAGEAQQPLRKDCCGNVSEASQQTGY